MAGLKGILCFLILCFLLPAHGEGVSLSDGNRQLPLSPLYQTPVLATFEPLNLPVQLDSEGKDIPWRQLVLTNHSEQTNQWILSHPIWQQVPKVYLHRPGEGLTEIPMEQMPLPMPARQLALSLAPAETVTLYMQGVHLPQTLWKQSWWKEWTQQQCAILLLLLGAQLTLLLCLGLMSLLPQLRTPLAVVPLLAFLPLLQFLMPPTGNTLLPPFWPIGLALAQTCANYRLFQHAKLASSLKKLLILQTLFTLTAAVVTLGLPHLTLSLIQPLLLVGCLISALALMQLLVLEHQGQWLLLAGLHLMTGILATALASGPELETMTLTVTQPLLMGLLVLLYLCQQLHQAQSGSKLRSNATLKELVRSKEAHLLEEQHEVLKNQFRELELQHRLLQEKNAIDFLTGLRNRQFFDERFSAEMARSARESTPISLLLIDIDHFKEVNDRFGHRIGDEVLKCVAKRFYYVLKRPSDAICRYGGEEFAIILPNTHGQGALHIAEIILNNIRAKPITTGQGDIRCTVSIGIASTVHSYHQSESKLIEDADKALYKAKENGRDRIELAPAKPYVVNSERNIKA